MAEILKFPSQEEQIAKGEFGDFEKYCYELGVYKGYQLASETGKKAGYQIARRAVVWGMIVGCWATITFFLAVYFMF